MVTALSVDQLVVRYGAVSALDGISLQVGRGEVLAVLGPSGSGKTTLLNAVAGFVPISGGEIRIDDILVASGRRSLPIEQRGVGVVFQSYGLWPHMDALDTVAYPLRRQGMDKAEARARAAELLERVGLAGFEHRRPNLLSGGQQQRVGLARALARKPRLFLFDEPTANLDSGLRAGLQSQIREQLERTEAAAVYVTHDPVEAFAVSDRIAAIRDAHLVQVATAKEIYAHPADAWIARLTGPCSLVDADVLDSSTVRVGGVVVCGVILGGANQQSSGGAAQIARRDVSLAVRPEWIRLDAPGALPLDATVETVAFAGAEMVCTLAGGGRSLAVHVPGSTDIRAGDRVSWGLTQACVLDRSAPPAGDTATAPPAAAPTEPAMPTARS
ncbi:MAG: hypothetical protein BGO26_13110 [Actinobacteria bacterium 69-20]|nr:MAG: hypothetical protein BGO26_13110 [Actinobacteria bacterium 69-20]